MTKEKTVLIKRTYALTPYGQDNIGMDEENIEHAIKPTLTWKVIIVLIRGITKEYAERRKSMENEKEHDIIKTMKTWKKIEYANRDTQFIPRKY